MLNEVERKNLLIHASEAGIVTVISCLDFDLISKRFNIFYDLHGVPKRYLSNNWFSKKNYRMIFFILTQDDGVCVKG
jgi:hypothetical protein